MNSNDIRNECNTLMAHVSRIDAQQRPERLPARLDAVQPGDVLVLIDAGQTPAQRRMVEVTALDAGAILVEGERFHRGHGFHLAGLAAGNLRRFVQPVDTWSVPGWQGSMRLELQS